MISRRSAAVALCLLTFAGCHEDPTVVEVTVQPTVEVLGLFADGGAASSAAGTDGTGGNGGSLRITSNGLVSLGSPAFVPTPPATPAVPAIATPSILTGQGDLTQPGSILIDGPVVTANAATVTYTSSSGDIVVSGALQSGAFGGAMTAITLQAPKGTVYVTGSIVTAGPDAVPNGQSGGALNILAARVVLTGSIDTHGVANTTVPGQNAGNGGNVTIISTQGPIFFTAGAIFTAGGPCVDTGAIGGIQGGNGGFVKLNAGTINTTNGAAVNAVYVFGPITTDGGTMTGPAATPTGGTGGDIVIQGLNDINIVANLSSLGGSSTGGGTSAVGGAGGNVKIDGGATARIYGLLDLGGGFAAATSAGGPVTGGNGGTLQLGQALAVNSVELGQGTYSVLGGAGQNTGGQGGGAGGTVAIAGIDGDITIGSSVTATGGAGTGAGNASGGNGGSISIVTDQQGSRLSNHLLSIASLASLLDVGGGAAAGTGVGGTGGTVLLQCAGNLTSGARINASGGSSVIGTGGGTTPNAITLSITGAGPITPTGEMNVAGEILTQGGVNSGGGAPGGGAGSSILFQIAGGNGSLTYSAAVNTSGGADPIGPGGISGNVTFSTAGGNIDLSGSVIVSGSASPVAPQDSGTITISGGGAIACSATLSAVGGTSTDPLGFVAGGKGNSILFDATGAFGGITLTNANVDSDGGSTLTGPGGNGGSITFRTRGQAIDLTGAMTARGGPAGGAGVGGTGGQLVANSDFGNSGFGGNITLEASSLIDVSGGAGAVQGAALWNPGPPGPATDPGPVLTLPIPLAVIFDADGDLGHSGTTNPGSITNLGTITATGSTGGDVWYNGLNSVGAPLSLSDGIGLNVTGPVPGHFYFH